MTTHPADAKSNNPRIQCSVCGKWKRLYTKKPTPPFDDNHQTFYGGCSFNNGDHLAGDHVDVCALCCDVECRRISNERKGTTYGS